jgi:hypothetical protein
VQHVVTQDDMLAIERLLELAPGFFRDLLVVAVLRFLALAAEDVPGGDIHGQHRAHAAVTARRGREFWPKLGLRDARQRPARVHVIDVPARDGHVRRQIELDPVHPLDLVSPKLEDAGQVRIERQELGLAREELGHHLDRQREHEVLALDRPRLRFRLLAPQVSRQRRLLGASQCRSLAPHGAALVTRGLRRAGVDGRRRFQELGERHLRLRAAGLRAPHHHALDAPALAVELDVLELPAELVLDPELAREVGNPRIDPHVVGRSVEDAIGRARARDEIEQELDAHLPDGARVRLLRAARDQVPRHADHEQALERLRTIRSVDVLPPRQALERLDAPLHAARHDAPELPPDEHEIIRANPHVPERRDVAQHQLEFSPVLRTVRGQRVGGRLIEREGHRFDRAQVLFHALSVERRNPHHRVRQVPIEPGEEAKAVLPRQRPTRPHGRVRHARAARLAAGHVALLEHAHREPSLG